MVETGRICGQGQIVNHPRAVSEFLTRSEVNGDSAAALEAMRKWAIVDSNHRLQSYQDCALTN